MFLRRIVLILVLLLPLEARAQGINDPNVLWQYATLYRDEWGTPHIYADNLRAMAFAFGYAQAGDHLEDMLVAYRIANGRASEVFGPSFADSDVFALKMGHAELARAALSNADSITIDLCEGFAIGVNAWLVENAAKSPAWAEGVRPEDVLSLMHYYLMSMAPLDLPGDSFRPVRPMESANAWAISPSGSVSGDAMLVINPHVAYDSPFQWYEAHLTVDDFEMAGATVFGLPVIMQGHNKVLGWALSPNKPDIADVFIEPDVHVPKRNPKAVNTPFFDPAVLLQAHIAAQSQRFFVKTQNGLEERYVECIKSPRGPIIGTYHGHACSYKVGGYGQFGTLRQFMEMGMADDLAEFKDALSMRQLPLFHVVYADAKENIFYLYGASAGNRRAVSAQEQEVHMGYKDTGGRPWTYPMDWSYAWDSLVPISGLPSLTNPSSGYIQACGTMPWKASKGSSIKAEMYPAWFSWDEDSYRARRARYLLGLGKRSFDEIQLMLYDALVPLAAKTVPKLLEAADKNPGLVKQAHPDLRVGLDILRKWNYTADTGSTGMTFFHAWWMQQSKWNAQAGHRPSDLGSNQNWSPPHQVLLQTASEAARAMRNEYGSLSVPWGKVHVVRRGQHEQPISGSTAGDPIFVSGDKTYDRGKWTANYGYGYAMVVKMGEQMEAASMSPFGSSQNPASAHYDDQLELMVGRRLKVTRFSRDDVLTNSQSAVGRAIELRAKNADVTFLLQTSGPTAARLNVLDSIPKELPEGVHAFSEFIELETSARAATAKIEMEMQILDESYEPGAFKLLALYSFDTKNGWRRLRRQKADFKERTISGQDDWPRVYAVLGPEEALPLVEEKDLLQEETESSEQSEQDKDEF